MSAPDAPGELGPDELEIEYKALLQFLHLAPVGLVRARHNGDVALMNPMAARLLAPLGFGDSDTLNLFEILDKASPDIRRLVQDFHKSAGVICDNFRVLLPIQHDLPARAEPIEALGVTVLRLQADPNCLMVVITDETAALKLQRLQATWIR